MNGNFKLRYPDFRKKAVTFSYDDGTFFDIFLVELFKKYGLKATFNLNTGLWGECNTLEWQGKPVYHNRISEEQAQILYKGHELAAHSLTHPLLINRPKEFLDKEILPDLANLERMTGKKTVGFVYPGGPHSEFTDNYLRDKVLYARTVESTFNFDLPESFVPLNPTVFHLQEEFLPLCKDYAALQQEEWSWLYIWGHAYEFQYEGVYEKVVQAFEVLSHKDDIWYSTNGEIISYVLCARKLYEEDGALVNDTECDIYLEYNGKNVIVPKKSRLKV